MGVEIERKFLVTGDAWRAGVSREQPYRQGYLKLDGESSVRVRIGSGRARLNIKSGKLSIRRTEYEYEIPLPDAEEILESLCIGSVIVKTRYFVPYAGLTWEVDVFEGDNAGLVVAEVELSTEDQVIETPDWVGEEVSLETRYYNSSLVTHPYKDWPRSGT